MSYVSQQFLLFDNSSNANFRNWAGAIDVALTTSGWTLTGDTGQTDPSSATVPVAGSFIYRIYAPADALQTGSTQFFLKVQYGTSSGSPAGPRLRCQLATSTDGAGNLTGLTTNLCEALNITNSTGQGSVITYDCYFSGDTDRFSMTLWRSLGSSQAMPCVFSVERTRNTDGTNSSDGVTYVCGSTGSGSGNNARGHQTIVFGVAAATITLQTSSNYVALSDVNNSSGSFNNNIPVSPVFPVYGKYGNPMTTIAFVHTQDVADGCIFTTTLYGATRTYLATAIAPSTPGSSRMCMRYD